METPRSSPRERKFPVRKSDILSDIMPIYHISKICGLLPVRFALVRPGRYIGQVDHRQACYGILLLLALTAAQCYGIYDDLRDGWQGSQRLSVKSLMFVTFSDILGAFGAVAVVILGSPCRWRFLRRALDKLVHVDEKLEASLALPPSHLRKLSVDVISATLACLICVSAMDVFSWSASSASDEPVNDDKVNYAPLYLMYLVIVTWQLQYAVVVFNVGERFGKLNRVIENLGDKAHDVRLRRDNAAPGDSMRKAMRSVLCDLDVRDRSAEGDEAQQAEAIDRLITLYGVLCDSVDCVNKAYGLAILVVALSCLVHLIITVYFLYNYICGPDPDNWALQILHFAWITFHFCRMILFVQPCHMVAVKAKRTGTLVNRASTNDWSPEVKKQLKIFSIQVLQRPVEFSACGLFYLNRGMLTSIVGLATTYMIILVQFQTSEDPRSTKDLIENASRLLRTVSGLRAYFQ